jgi:hypothetical protein
VIRIDVRRTVCPLCEALTMPWIGDGACRAAVTVLIQDAEERINKQLLEDVHYPTAHPLDCFSWRWTW